MISTMTRQDLLNVTEYAKNKIIERLVTKYDVQAACDHARDRIINNLQDLHQENQSLMRHSNTQHDQVSRKVSSIESQINALQQEMKVVSQLMTRLYEQQVRLLNATQQR